MRVALFVACFALTGCGDDDTIETLSPDLSATAPLDLARGPNDLGTIPDQNGCFYPPDAFGPPLDAGGFCEGTPLAGTCAQTFFAKLASCFQPAGCCQADGSNTLYRSWQSGAHYIFRMGTSYYSFSQNDIQCASSLGTEIQPYHQWTASDGSTIIFDPATGALTCPGDAQINVGAYGSCPALEALLHQFQCPATPDCCTPYPLR